MKQTTVKPIFVSVADAAVILACSRAYVYKLLGDGVIESRKMGGARKVVLASLEEYAADLPSKTPAVAS